MNFPTRDIELVRKVTVYIILFIITCIAAALRVYHLGVANLWIDEAWTLYVTQHAVYTVAFLDVHPPLYYLLVKIPVTLWGSSESVLRSVSMLFGVVSVPLTYVFGKEITGKSFPGLFAALLMAISVDQIMQGQNARMYTLVLVLFILMVVFFLRAYNSGGYKWWGLTTACAILGMWTWYFFILPVGICLMWFILRDRNKVLDNKPFLYSAIAFVSSLVLLTVPFFVALALKTSEGNNLIYRGFEVPYQVFISQLGSPPALALVIGIFSLCGLLLFFRDNETYAGFLGLMLFVSLAVGSLVSFKIMMLPRYFIFIAPIFYTMIGYVIWVISQRNYSRVLKVCSMSFLVLVVVSSFCISIPVYYTEDHNWSGEWKTHANDFAMIKGNATEIALIGNPAYVLLFSYYAPRDPGVQFDRFDSMNMLVPLIRGKESLVLIPDYPIPEDNLEGRKIYDWLQDRGVKEKTYRGFEVYRVYAEMV